MLHELFLKMANDNGMALGVIFGFIGFVSGSTLSIQGILLNIRNKKS